MIRVPRYAYRCYLALINSQPSRRKRGRLHATDSSQPGTNPRALQPPRRIRLFELFRASAGSAALVRPPWPTPGPPVEDETGPGRSNTPVRPGNSPIATNRATIRTPRPARIRTVYPVSRSSNEPDLGDLSHNCTVHGPPNGPIRRQIQVRWGASRSSVAGSAHSVLRPGRAVSMVPSLCLPLSLFLSLSLSLHLSHTCPFLSPFCHPDVLARHSCGRRRTAAASRSRQASRGLA